MTAINSEVSTFTVQLKIELPLELKLSPEMIKSLRNAATTRADVEYGEGIRRWAENILADQIDDEAVKAALREAKLQSLSVEGVETSIEWGDLVCTIDAKDAEKDVQNYMVQRINLTEVG